MKSRYILNIGLILEPSKFNEVIEWAKGNISRFTTAEGIDSFDLLEVAEVPGDPDFGKDARNLSIQLNVDSIETAHSWIENTLPEMMTEYNSLVQEPLIFMTILKKLL
ncbi:MAG: hypothetical protein HDS94_02465 [Bacteroidales bacterium]|nr:hypothetical protein [Bacteroidales bacterium]